MLDIVLERETANDETATVVAVYYSSGAPVKKGAVIFDIENSKATQEVEAPEHGVLTHDLEVGSAVPFGSPIAQIATMEGDSKGLKAPPATTAAPTTPKPDTAAGDLAPPQKTRFSHAALALMEKHEIRSDRFSEPFVTSSKVLAKLTSNSSLSKISVRTEETGASEPVSSNKRAEIEALLNGAGGTMLSVLGAGLGNISRPRTDNDLLAGRITDLVIYEASRLMRKYPRLNASYADGRVRLHDFVHAGLAIDDGGRLVVYGIENADRTPLVVLPEIIADAAARYATNDLTSKELSRATYTITDLSANNIDFVLPLLPRGQSCILGITHSETRGYHLYAGFDHRVTEGREVAAFLDELRVRLQSFDAGPVKDDRVGCSVCSRLLKEATGRSGDIGFLKIVGRDGRDALCCASCWNGW
jgi:pyruvate/2-oxoglutarate dehydrogenase complex dihydrolipoamide acyltransferase (E2) component